MRVGTLAMLCGALLLSGCGDDEAPAPDTGSDAGSDVSTGECEGVVVAEDAPGEPCEGLCGEGLQCTRFEVDTEAVCRQVCVPDVCESVCAEGQICAPLDGAPGTGVCADPVTGGRGAYESCGTGPGFCLPELRCTQGSADAEEGVCLPPCVDDMCEAMSGYEGQCVITIQGEEGRFCTAKCETPGSESECPGTMVCADQKVCIW